MLEPKDQAALSKGLIILVFPRFKFGQYPIWLPLEIVTLGASLQAAGYQVRLIDERHIDDTYAAVQHEVGRALFVGVSARPGDQVSRSLKIFETLKRHHPGIKSVWGGWFPSSYPDECIACPDVDFVIRGPGDHAVVELADALRGHGRVEVIKGLVFRGAAGLVNNGHGALEDLNTTSPIPWEALPIDKYLTDDGCLSLYTSRGCPGTCRFCGVPTLFPGIWSGYRAERVVDDVELLYHRHGARIFKLLDTDFFPDYDRVKDICRGIIARDLQLKWIADVRVKDMICFDDEMWDLLARSGCAELETGAEAGDEQQLELMHKECTADQIHVAVSRAVDRDICVRANFILGLPKEGPRELRHTLALVHRLDALGPRVKFQFYRFTPSPRTRFGAETWRLRNDRHDGQAPRDVASMLRVPINHDEAEMFWLDRRQEHEVKRFYYTYLPLGYYLGREPGPGRWLVSAMGYIGRWRTRRGIGKLPFESWICRVFRIKLPRSRAFEWYQDLV
ncbi:MAG: B12-binding domain-containing radical SAM protein [Salinibacterium sp.]|nr:B12-binding domain-containing radical SAM protein [Salinibacterium sp.]